MKLRSFRFLALIPAFAATSAFATLQLSTVTAPSAIVGGFTGPGTATLNGAAPADTTITLTSNLPQLSVPPTVVVKKGAISAGFTLTANPVTAPVVTTLTARGPNSSIVVVKVTVQGSIDTGQLTSWGVIGLQESSSSNATVAQVASGNSFNVALRADGTIVCWGFDAWGGCAVPAGIANAVQVAAGGGHSAALLKDGTVVCWGDNRRGESVVPVGLTGVTQIALGINHTVARKSDGTVVCWGDNQFGESAVPSGLTGVVQVAAGDSFTLALKSDGTVVGWGKNNFGQAKPVGLSGVAHIAAGSAHGIALKSDGTVECWGSNISGQSTVPAGLTGVTQVSAGYGFTAARLSTGKVVAWGDSLLGQSTVPATLKNVAQISCGSNHTLALSTTGAITGWGDGVYSDTIVPAQLTNITQVSSGQGYFAALKSNGTVYCWGDNTYGQCNVPVGLSGVVQVAAGLRHVVALTQSQTLVGWGDKSHNELKFPTTPTNNIIQQVAAGNGYTLILYFDTVALVSNVGGCGSNILGQLAFPGTGNTIITKVVAGVTHAAALRVDGSILLWGDNSFGAATIPSGLPGVLDIALGYRHNVANLATAPTFVFGWGMNTYGQDNPPVATGYASVAAGYQHSIGLRTDGTLRAWGDNEDGECRIPAGYKGVQSVIAGLDLTAAMQQVSISTDKYKVAVGSGGNVYLTVPGKGGATVSLSVSDNHLGIASLVNVPIGTFSYKVPFSILTGAKSGPITIKATSGTGATNYATITVG